MSDEIQGLTRREILRRGVVTGGAALAWATPVVTTIGLNRALATATSPGECTPAISYIAINFTCNGTQYFSKFDDGGWDPFTGNPTVEAECIGFVKTGTGVEADDFGFSASLSTGNLTVPPTCTVEQVAVKGGDQCNVFAPGWGSGTFNVGCPSD
jgi:hypothetical protein